VFAEVVGRRADQVAHVSTNSRSMA
jgi:hypothetical protein